MAKVRLSTTVDRELLARARELGPHQSDASLVERALRALLDAHRATQIDAAYAAAYAERPLDVPDDWGDLASFSEAIGKQR